MLAGVIHNARDAADRLLAWADGSRARTLGLLAALAFLAFLPGLFSIPPIDRDEARFAQATRQMLETGDYVDIRLQEEARHKKPIGIYWLQAAAAQITGYGAAAPIWVYRLPSLGGAVAGVLVAWWALLPLVGRRAALIAGLLLASTILLGVEARIAKTDAALFAAIVGAMGVLARAFLEPARVRASLLPWVFWALIGAGILIKGPIAPMVAGLAALVLVISDRSWRWLLSLRPGWGALLALAIVSPWLVAIWIESGGAFFRDAVMGDMISKVGEAGERHGGPPGYHSALFWVLSWPAAAFVAVALPWIWTNRGRREVVVLLAWAGPTFLVFELISTKLPHYVLPAYPAVLGLAALAIGDGVAAARAGWRRAMFLGVWMFPLAAVLVASAALIHFEGRLSAGLVVFGAITVALGVVTAGVARASLAAAAPVAAAAAVAFYLAAHQFAVPALQTVWLSGRMAAAARAEAHCAEPRLASAAFHEPSLVFLTRTDLVMANGAGAAEFLAAGGCRLAFVDAAPRRAGATPEETGFRARAAELGLAVEQVAMVEGRNINGGHLRRMGLWRAAPPVGPSQASQAAAPLL